ncbi:MAG: hypothetical protein K1X92_08910 [Bacteroidia bacterium]|nr:hypothetical protein [Bacteroidia bacterium]
MEEFFLKQLATQGFAVVILVGLIWVLYKRQTAMESKNETRMTELESKLENLHNERKTERDQFVELTTDLRNVVQENSTIIKQIGDYLGNNTNRKTTTK